MAEKIRIKENSKIIIVNANKKERDQHNRVN